MQHHFRRLADATAKTVGAPETFLLAAAIIALWALSGPYFRYSDTWQLFINTGTSIVTVLAVFLIQSTQNRDTRIFNLKLDELLRAHTNARTAFVGLNTLSDADLEDVHQQFVRLSERVRPLVEDDLALISEEVAARRRRLVTPQSA